MISQKKSNCSNLMIHDYYWRSTDGQDWTIFDKEPVCNVLSFKINISIPYYRPEPTTRYVLDKGDYQQMREHVRKVEWTDLFKEDEDINKWCHNLDTVLKEAMDLYIPKKTIKSQHPNSPPKRTFYAPDTLLAKIHNKRKAWKYYKKYPTTLNLKDYHFQRNLVTKEHEMLRGIRK